MTAHPMPYGLCPFQPRPEPSSIIGSAAPVPSNACNEEKCRLWMRAFDEKGRFVAAYCAVAGIVAGLGQVAGLLSVIANAHASMETPSVGDGPPAA